MKLSEIIKAPVRVEEQGKWFAFMYDSENVKIGKILSQAQAHAIARAINCHDRLVESLEWLCEILDDHDDRYGEDALIKHRALLKEATGENDGK